MQEDKSYSMLTVIPFVYYCQIGMLHLFVFMCMQKNNILYLSRIDIF